MADDLNAEAASVATVSENNGLMIPFDESLEPIHSNTTDQEHVEDVTPDNCAIITVDIDESIVSSEVITANKYSLTMTTEHDIKNEDLEIKVEDKNTDEKLLDIDCENKPDQSDTGETECLDNDEPAMSVPNIVSKSMESISKIEINIDQADQIVNKDIIGINYNL